jgi:predicted RNA-binding protein with PUA-like domain
MKYWLLKTEPSVYNYSDLEKEKQTVWDGVTSPGGLFQIKQVNKGDIAFIYHTGAERQVVGLAEITTLPYSDKKADNPKLFVFNIKPLKRLKKYVTLEMMKNDKVLSNSRIVREGRLSVVPLSKIEFNSILQFSGEIV